MPIIDIALVITIGGLIGAFLIRNRQVNQQRQQLEDAFYRLLEIQQGRISLIQLAMAARVEPQLAKRYLDSQVTAFEATAEVDGDGDTFYRFPKLRLERQQRA